METTLGLSGLGPLDVIGPLDVTDPFEVIGEDVIRTPTQPEVVETKPTPPLPLSLTLPLAGCGLEEPPAQGRS